MTLTNKHDIDLLFGSPNGVYSSLHDMNDQEFEIFQHVAALYANKEGHKVYKNLNIELQPHNFQIDDFLKI